MVVEKQGLLTCRYGHVVFSYRADFLTLVQGCRLAPSLCICLLHGPGQLTLSWKRTGVNYTTRIHETVGDSFLKSFVRDRLFYQNSDSAT